MRLIADEKGLALPLILIIVMVLTLLGGTIFWFAMNETKQVARAEDKMKAHYVARSGAHAVATYLINNPEQTMLLVDSPAVEQEFGEGTFEVEVYSNPNEIHIRSTGKVEGVEQTIIAIVKDVGTDFPLFGNIIGFQGEPTGTTIAGGDVYYRTANNINNVEAIVVDGSVYQLDRVFPPVILPCDDPGTVFYENGCPPPINTYSGLTITESIGYGNGSVYADIKLTSKDMVIESSDGEHILVKANLLNMGNNDLIVKLDNNIVAIVVNEFTDCKLFKIEGSGSLVFYVNKWSSRGNFDINHDNDDVTVNVFVTNEPEPGLFELKGTPNFYGSIYAPDASFIQSGSGKGSFTGWIIANEFIGGAGMELYYYSYELIGTGLDLSFLRIAEWRY